MSSKKQIFFVIIAIILMGSFAQPVHAVACVSNGTGGGNWYDGSTWAAGCGAFGPANGDSAQILAGDTVTLNGDLTGHTLTSIVVDSGGILASSNTSNRQLNSNTITVNGTFRIDEGGFVENGTFSYGVGSTLHFANTSDEYDFVGGSHIYWLSNSDPTNLIVGSGGLDMNSATRTISGSVQLNGVLRNASNLTIDGGMLQLNSGYNIFDGSPNYTNGVDILYNSGGSPTVGAEWTNDPQHVQLANNTSLSFGNGSAARNMTGNLIIDSGSSLYMGDGTNNDFTVGGNVLLNGHLGLPFNGTGNIQVAGDWTLNNSGSFDNNGSSVIFNGATTQTIHGDKATAFANVTVNANTTLIDGGSNVATATSITNNGVIRRAETVTGGTTGNLDFGLPGVTMNVNSTAAGTIQVDRIAGDHPNAAAGMVGNSEHYAIAHSGSPFDIDLTFLNFSGDTVGLRSCRFLDPSWDCQLDDNAGDTTTLTRNNVTAFSDWAACGNCGPNSIQLRELTAVWPTSPMLISLGTLLLVGLATLMLLRQRGIL